MSIRIMICGASGFIGRNLFEHFSHSDSDFDVWGTYSRHKPKTTQQVRLLQADLRNIHDALWLTKDADIVINCAAMTDGMGAFDPNTYILPNLQINQNLIEAALINKVRHFIFLSCTVMYPSSTIPLKEHECDPERVHDRYIMPARMKLAGEDLCRICAKLGNTKYTIVRHTNIYGPYDKFDLKRGHVLPATITKVMAAENEIVVWGPGTESRDFLYIQDLIRFIEIAIQKQQSEFEIFNVGQGRTHSVSELVKAIIHCSGKQLEIVHNLEQMTIPTLMNIDVEKAKRKLGWEAGIGLEEGLAKTISWYRNQQSKVQ